MSKKKYKKGDVVYSPVNYKVKSGKRVGSHNAVILEDTNRNRVKTKLITHSKEHSHELSESDFEGRWKPDKKSRISKDKFFSISKLFKNKSTKYKGK